MGMHENDNWLHIVEN